jgi:asparagine synthase (glutamine-hydrolysing)
MCGILTIVNSGTKTESRQLIDACSIIRHRGPDDEGLLTWSPGEEPVVWAGSDTAPSTHQHWRYNTLQPGQKFKVGFGHRRLSILDLSPAGHQPMLYQPAGLSITFNGEIYNYLEIKAELAALGHTFNTTGDTEVILHAWAQWGVDCLARFNGMFAFVLLDHNRRKLYAVRDRFGVKPLYYYKGDGCLYLASEIKQIRTAPGYKLSVNEKAVRQYLASGAVDQTPATFDSQVFNIPQGHYLAMDLDKDAHEFTLHKWYEMVPRKWTRSYEDAAEKLKEILTGAIDLRLRSDVPVGSCLSGGLDSSSIVCIVADLLKERGETAGQETVTACYEQARFDEWKFAQEVIKKTNARSHRTFPSFKNLFEEAERFIWHQDEPTASTSQFSQWSVFKACHEANLKVMVDGQGADEQLAGYGGNDIPYYSGLLRRLSFLSLADEALHYKKEKGHWPIGFLLNAIKLNTGQQVKVEHATWMRPAEPTTIHAQPALTLQENLRRQLYMEPLPSLLRYEDRNSMAWSVESRTPFMDYRLVEFTAGLPERFIYRNGTRKAILRSAMKTVLPPAITDRKDKMGFVTPEELWLRGEGKEWFLAGAENTCRKFGNVLDPTETMQQIHAIADSKSPFSFMPWRVLCLGKWHDSISKF